MPAEVVDPIAITPPPEIPDKLYFRIGEVSRLAGIKPYVLRFWESEFPGLDPKKSGTGQRLYRRKDVELIFQIKRLLYDQRYTIEGARKMLENDTENTGRRRGRGKAETAPAAQSTLFTEQENLDQIRKELAEILAILS